MKLGHSTTALPALKKSLLLDHQSLIGYFSDLKNQERKMPVTEVFVSEEYDLARIRGVLEESVRVLPVESARMDLDYYSPKKNFYQEEVPMSSHRNNTAHQASYPQITEPDYFSASCKHKYLHFFIPVSRELKLLGLESAVQGGHFRSITFKSKN